jgi:hypothetical protein
MTEQEQESKAAYASELVEEFVALLDISHATIAKLGARHGNMVSNTEVLTVVSLLLIQASIASQTPMDMMLVLLGARIPGVEKVVKLARLQSATGVTP